MTHNVLAIDIGTSSTRAVLVDTFGNIPTRVVAQVPNAMRLSTAGDLSFDADRLFENVVAVIDRAVDEIEIDHRITLAFCTLVTNILGVDSEGRPATPGLTYACPSATPDVTSLRQELGVERIAATRDRTGCPLHTSYLPAQLRWIQRTNPDWLRRSRQWMSIGEYVYWRFTGQRTVTFSVASWTGLFDRRRRVWDEEWLDRLPIADASLSPLDDVRPWANGLHTEWVKRWPKLRRVTVVPAIGDGAGANVGSGCLDERGIAITIGTTAALRMTVPTDLPTLPDGLWFYYITAERGLLGGATTEGGGLLEWLRETLNLPGLADLDQTIREREPAGHGLTLLPFVAGERAPGWNDRAQAVLAGFRLGTDAIDIYQAAMEAIAYRLALIYQRVKQATPRVEARRVMASGGALTRSPAFLQTMADVLGEPVHVLAETELSAFGTALVAAAAVTGQPLAANAQIVSVYAPDSARAEMHRLAMLQQVDLYERLFVQGRSA